MDKQTQMLIESTINHTIDKLNSITTVDRMQAMKNETFKNAEKLLYNYNSLKEHVADENEYFDMMYKNSSKSIVRYSKSKVYISDDEMLKSREGSYLRSKGDLQRIEKAVKKVKDKKEFNVIQLRYFSKKHNGDTYTFEEIAEILSNSGDYSDTLNEKTVRRWRSSIVQEIAISLFGSDAI